MMIFCASWGSAYQQTPRQLCRVCDPIGYKGSDRIRGSTKTGSRRFHRPPARARKIVPDAPNCTRIQPLVISLSLVWQTPLMILDIVYQLFVKYSESKLNFTKYSKNMLMLNSHHQKACMRQPRVWAIYASLQYVAIKVSHVLSNVMDVYETKIAPRASKQVLHSKCL